MTKKQFIDKIGSVIITTAIRRGYKYPSAIIAQAACESTWGNSQLSSKYHNYFGMKCGSKWTGRSVNMTTKEEYTTGNLTTIKDNFRAYSTLQEGIDGYFDFIEKNKRYSNLKEASSPIDYIEKLKADGWATSSTYVNTLKTILTSNTLTQFDKEAPFEEVTDNERAIAQDVIYGKYGNGVERKDNIYKAIQRAVNQVLLRS